jgi:hypothetical protein
MDHIALVAATAGLAGLGMLCAALLAGWRGWLELKLRELDHLRHGAFEAGTPHGGPHGSGRIEIADLKERIRKLEAIAAGVDL